MTRSPRSTVVPHLTYSPFTFPYDLSVRQSLPIPLAVDIYLLRLHHFETISTHSILIKLLKQRSVVQIISPIQIGSLCPFHRTRYCSFVLTTTSLKLRSDIQNLLYFVFISIQIDLLTISGRSDSSKSTRFPFSTINPLFGRSVNFTTRINLETCTTGNNLYGVPGISNQTAWFPHSSATLNIPCHMCGSLRAYPALTLFKYSYVCVPHSI